MGRMATWSGSGRRERAWRWAMVAALAALLVGLQQHPLRAQGTGGDGASVELIGVATDGAPADRDCIVPATNTTGDVVAFKSDASNLDPRVTEGHVNVFVRDRAAGVTERVSLAVPVGAQPNQNSFPPALDDDGGVVAFASAASNLVFGDYNRSPDLFTFDRTAKVTSVLTLEADGFSGGGLPDLPPALSADARFAVFSSTADDLVPNDTNEASDVFIHDRSDNTISLISVATVGGQQGSAANGASIGATVSADGCAVAFVSDATNLSTGDTNESCDVFVRDRCEEVTERIATQTQGPCKALGLLPAISADGSAVAIASDAADLVAGDNNALTDVFVYDRRTGVTTRLSQSGDGASGNAASLWPSISADGRFVAFQSAATNLVGDGGNGKTQVFAADVNTGRLQRLSQSASGEPGNNDSTAPQISRDGVSVVFQSAATNLVSTDTHGVTNVFAVVNPLSFTPTPTATSTTTVTPTVTGAPTATPTPSMTRTPTVTATLTPGDFCPAACQTGQECLRNIGGQIRPGVCLPEADCVCFVEGAETVSPTPTATPTGPSPTATGPTRTPTAGAGGRGGGGGCSCRIDPGSGRTADSLPLPALVVPIALWAWRRRSR
jgi:hypothetical protein